MIIAIPKERKNLEKRVAVTPLGAKELIEAGQTVLIEQNAGSGSFYSDQDYISAGCEIISSQEELWKRANLVVKVKEPHESEYKFFRPDLSIFAYLHLAGLPEVARQLLNNKTTSIAYELVQEDSGFLPLLAPMSQIAGKLSVQNAANFLLTQYGGRGVLLGGTNKVSPGKVVIIGAGIAGFAACEVAVGMGANVTILDLNEKRLLEIKSKFPNVSTLVNNTENLNSSIVNADIVISAVLIPGAKAPKVISKSDLKQIPRGAVLVDISIDQGGSIEGIKTTSLESPIYIEDEILFYAVPNMPSQSARTSTKALTTETLPFILELAKNGAYKNKALSRGVCTVDGKIVNQVVSEALSKI